MIHLYAGSISATNGYKTASTAIGIKARSKNEAIGIAIEHALQVFPTDEYYNHQTSVIQIHDEFILEAASYLLEE